MADHIPRSDEPRPSQIVVMTGLIGLAYLPLAAHLAPQISAYIAFLIVLRLVSVRWTGATPGRWLLFPLTLGGGFNVYHAYQSLSGPEAGTALLATMMALKLIETRRLRDIRFSTVLFGFLLTTQFLLDQSPALAFYLVALLVADIALMVDLNAPASSRRGASAVRTAGRLTLQALPLTLILFVLFPRLSAPLWDMGQITEKARSGVKDWLEPGMMSELVLSGELAFRARFHGPAPETEALYWRGPVLWSTDGRRWVPGEFEGVSDAPARLQQTEGEVSYSVLMQPSGKRWLFPLDLPLAGPRGSRITPDFRLVAARPVNKFSIFHLTSALRYRTGELELDQELAGLQLPDNITQRMRDLVAEWQSGPADPEEVVRRGLEFINREPFYYTLSPPTLGANPVDEFLFESKRGFCEHYASSFALLMRIADIPSRVVLGYLGGETNPVGGHVIVRQSDAHAWVEVWLEGKGWTRVDPTAAIASGRVESSELLAGLASGRPVRFRLDETDTLVRWAHNLRLLADSLDEGWRNWVLGFGSERQRRMLEAVGLGFLRQYGLALATIIAASVALGLLVAGLSKAERSADPLDRIYRRFCTRLKRAGLARRANEGPADFAARAGADCPELKAPIDAFTTLYLRLRYGPVRSGQGLRELAARLPRVKPWRVWAGSVEKGPLLSDAEGREDPSQ